MVYPLFSAFMCSSFCILVAQISAIQKCLSKTGEPGNGCRTEVGPVEQTDAVQQPKGDSQTQIDPADDSSLLVGRERQDALVARRREHLLRALEVLVGALGLCIGHGNDG